MGVIIRQQTRTITLNMNIKYLLLLLAAGVAPITADARIFFQQPTKIFSPKDLPTIQNTTTTSAFPSSTTTRTTTTITTTTTTEQMPLNSSMICPENEDWCDSPADYPEDTILKAALSQENTIRSLFDSQSRPGIQTRMQEFDKFVADEMENICSVRTEYIMPRAAKNKDGEYKYIVNHPPGAEEYVQQVRVTICSEAEKSCGHGLLEETGLRTRCRQEYSDHKLVALSATREELQVETFQFPSCCTCYLSHFTEY